MAQDAPALPEVAASELEYQGEITFWNTMRDFEFAEVQKLIDAWTAAHPGISVKHTAQSFDTARADYQNAAPAGTAPDILRADIGWTIGFADDGYLLDLTDKVSDWDDYIGVPLATATWKGATYGLPHVTDALGLQCNKSLLAEAGLDAAPTSWQELVDAGSTIADLEAQKYGFYMRGDSYWVQPFTWGWGGQLYEVADDGTVTVKIEQPRIRRGLELPQGQHPRHRRPGGTVGLHQRLRQHDHRLQGRHHHVRPQRPLAGGGPPHR